MKTTLIIDEPRRDRALPLSDPFANFFLAELLPGLGAGEHGRDRVELGIEDCPGSIQDLGEDARVFHLPFPPPLPPPGFTPRCASSLPVSPSTPPEPEVVKSSGTPFCLA